MGLQGDVPTGRWAYREMGLQGDGPTGRWAYREIGKKKAHWLP